MNVTSDGSIDKQSAVNALIEQNENLENYNIILTEILEIFQDISSLENKKIKINDVLGTIAKLLNSTRAFIFEAKNLNDTNLCHYLQIHEWSINSDSFVPDFDEFSFIPCLEEYRFIKNTLVNDKRNLYYKFDDLKKQDMIELFKKYNIKSLMMLPLFYDENFFGFIMFENSNKYNGLRIVDNNMSNLISDCMMNIIKRIKTEAEREKLSMYFVKLFSEQNEKIKSLVKKTNRTVMLQSRIIV